MGGAKRGYPVVSHVLAALRRRPTSPAQTLIARCRDELRATVHAVNRLTPTIVEVVVRAPAAARAFRPGQFYRLQNYEMLAPRVDEPGIGAHRAGMEGLAMTGAWTDPERGLVSVIVLEMGGSSDLCALLKPGEPVVLMGPTGTPTEIPANDHRALVGGGLGQCGAVLHRRGAARGRLAGALLRRLQGRCATATRCEEIERAADVIVWCCDEAPGFAPNPDRPQDRASSAISCRRWRPTAPADLATQAIPLSDVDAHDRHRLRPHDAGGRRGAARRAGDRI